MDGVLVDARDWHYQSLNEALELFGYSINYNEHLEKFDGLPTSVKLDMLSKTRNLPVGLHPIINACKQEITLKYVANYCHPKPNILAIISNFKNQEIKIGLATNSIKRTTLAMMEKSGLLHYFDQIVTNEDVTNAKPNPEIYVKAAQLLGLNPRECLVFEDNPKGISAAQAAGCDVYQVKEPDSFFLDEVIQHLKEAI